MGLQTTIVGGGAMGASIVRGLIDQGVTHHTEIRVVELVPERRSALDKEFGVITTADLPNSGDELPLVILAVKPQNFGDLARRLRPAITSSTLLISIMAGVPRAALNSGLGTDRIVRAMPNIAAQVGHGVSVWISDSGVTDFDRELTRTVLGALGTELEIEHEPLIDVATAVHGSGPAYVFLLAEAWIDAAVGQGLDQATAELLVRETILGSGQLWKISNDSPAALRQAVTSPGGTTAAAIEALAPFNFPSAMRAAIDAATERARELG